MCTVLLPPGANKTAVNNNNNNNNNNNKAHPAVGTEYPVMHRHVKLVSIWRHNRNHTRSLNKELWIIWKKLGKFIVITVLQEKRWEAQASFSYRTFMTESRYLDVVQSKVNCTFCFIACQIIKTWAKELEVKMGSWHLLIIHSPFFVYCNTEW
jgi:hypothetical protein